MTVYRGYLIYLVNDKGSIFILHSKDRNSSSLS